MKKSIVAAIALMTASVVALPLTAQPAMQKPGSRNLAAIKAGTYQADPNHTLVGWRVNHLGFSPYFGIFGDVTGTLVIDPRRPAAAMVDVTIPVSKVTTASAGLTAHLLRAPKAGAAPDFFGPRPADARFVSTSVTPKGRSGKARMLGNLTLNGVTRPVALDVEFYGAGSMPVAMGGGDNIGFEARGMIRRSEFGLTMAIPMVSDEVVLDIAAAFQNGGATSSAATPASDECGASKLGGFIGRPADTDTRVAISAATRPDRIRVIRAGESVTMDYSATRLNVETDTGGRIIKFRCG